MIEQATASEIECPMPLFLEFKASSTVAIPSRWHGRSQMAQSHIRFFIRSVDKDQKRLLTEPKSDRDCSSESLR